MKTPSVIVIGAGVGGMAATAHLARGGVQVTVLEKNSHPGGRCDRFSREGHTFDSGPSLLVMPLLYEAEFAALGASMRERLALQRIDPTYHLVFEDGSRLNLTSDLQSMREQLEAIQPGSYHGFLRYVEEGHRHYHLAMERLVNRDFRKAADFFSLANVPLLYQLKPFIRHYGNLSAYFDRLKPALGQSNSQALAEYLLEEAKVAAVPGQEFGEDACIRLSYATSRERSATGVTRIREALEKLGK